MRGDAGRASPGTRSCRPSCSSGRRTAPKQIVVKDPAANAEGARRLSRYPAGHGEGYGQAFRNLFADVYAAVAGQPHGPFPTFRDGLRGVAAVEAAVASARSGAWVEVEA